MKWRGRRRRRGVRGRIGGVKRGRGGEGGVGDSGHGSYKVEEEQGKVRGPNMKKAKKRYTGKRKVNKKRYMEWQEKERVKEESKTGRRERVKKVIKLRRVISRIYCRERKNNM